MRRLAVGGMAEVYLAVTEGLSGFEKPVVLKRLHPQHARDPDLLAMFLDEARLMARLRHRHIAEVYDIGAEGADFYFTMERIVGPDVREVLRALRGAPLPMPHALTIARGAARGLHYAHEMRGDDGVPLNIVHRDVSPSNLLVSREGFASAASTPAGAPFCAVPDPDAGAVKLIDFGVAKWDAQRTATRHGTLKGKVAYMSPEQARGEVLDRRSDVFALGVVLYELLSGARPFEGGSEYDVLRRIVTGELTSLGRRCPDLPAAVTAAVDRALEARPESRFPSAAAFADRLEDVAKELALEASEAALAIYLSTLFGPEADAWAPPSVAEPATEVQRKSGSAAVADTERTQTDWQHAPARLAADPSKVPATHAGQMAKVPATRAPRASRRVLTGAVLLTGLGLAASLWFRPPFRPAGWLAPASASRAARLAPAPTPPPVGWLAPSPASTPPPRWLAPHEVPSAAVEGAVPSRALSVGRREERLPTDQRRRARAARVRTPGADAYVDPRRAADTATGVRVWDPDSPIPPP